MASSESKLNNLRMQIKNLENKLAKTQNELSNLLTANGETEKKYISLLESSDEAIFIFSLTYSGIDSLLEANNAACNMFGYEKEELLRTPIEKIFTPEILRLAKNETASVQNRNALETVQITKGGERIPIEARFKIFKSANKTYTILFIKNLSGAKKSPKALSFEKKLLKKLLEDRNLLVVGFDKNRRIQIFNKGAEIITGFQKSEVIGKDWHKIFITINFEKKLDEAWKEACGKNTLSFVNAIINKSGNKKIILWHTMEVFEDKNKDNELLLSWGIDISDESVMGKKLLGSEKRYRELLGNIENAILIIENGKFIFCNNAAVKMLNYKNKEKLLNLHPSELSPEYQPDGKKSFIKAKEMMQIAREKGSHRFEWLHKKADGEVFSVEVLLTKISTDDGKDIFHTVWRDITEQKRAVKQLQKLSQAIVQSPVIVLITNLKGKIEYVNPKFSEVTGYSAEEVYNKTPRILKSGFHTKDFYKNFWETILSGKTWKGEFYNKKKNGELYWESAIVSPLINDAGEITHFVGVEEDITEKKKMVDELILAKKKAESADKMKSIFLAQMSHEIRTPISAMLSLSSLLKEDLEDQVDEDTKLSLELIGKAGMRIIRTINLLLNLSEIQAGSYEPIFERVKLYPDILGKVIAEYNKAAKDKGLILKLELKTEKIETLADQYTVEQIFTQLVDNAIKYTNEGEIKIIISRNDKEQLVVEISDTGIGIAKEYLPQLFEPFTQEEMGYTRKYEGNGIGMALVKSYCDINKASIEVESEKGKGATFRVVFPS